jgi:hypothetical protein
VSSQTARGRRGLSPRTKLYEVQTQNDLEAAFVYADGCQRAEGEIGHVDYDGAVYNGEDRKVGQVTATIDDVGEIYRGYDERLGYVRVAPNGDGYVYTDGTREQLLLGVVTARGEVFTGRYGRKVGTVQPPLDAERMGAAALLLGLL